MVDSIRIEKNVPMEMRDGTILRADIYRPYDDGKYPAILQRTPYNKITMAERQMLSIYQTVQAGYSVVCQDVRGRFASEGKIGMSSPSLNTEGDGYDSVEWLAAQSWCDSNIGTEGASANAAVQWMTAMEYPPHLKAIAPWMVGADTVAETPFGDGVIILSIIASSTPAMGIDIADKLEKAGKDSKKMREMLHRALAHPEEVYNHLPLKDVPHFNFDGIREMWQSRLLNSIPDTDAAKKMVFPFHKINLPCSFLSGWFDNFCRPSFHSFENMTHHGGSQIARNNQFILIGPWIHDGPQAFLGNISFGSYATTAISEENKRQQYKIAFFDKFLRGKDSKIPAVQYFLMGRNIWKEADAWPLPQTKWQKYYLHSKGQANSVAGNGLVSLNEPGAESPDLFIYNPLFPVMTAGGRGRPACGFVPGPINQIIKEKRNDVLCYTSEELKEDMEITGPIEIHLFASTTTRDTDFTAMLCDVYPDGLSINIADGIIRAQYRNSILSPGLVNPGEVCEYIIRLGQTSQQFNKGHRIRIDISSSNFPTYDRNMNTGNPIGTDTNGIPTLQTIFHDSKYPSYILMPVIPEKMTD